MTSLENELKATAIEACLQRILREDIDNDVAAPEGDGMPRHLRSIKALMCELILYQKYRSKALEFVSYLRLPAEYAEPLSPAISCGGLKVVEYVQNFLCRLHGNRSSDLYYDAILLRPMWRLVEISELHILADIARTVVASSGAMALPDKVNPQTPPRLTRQREILEEVANLYSKHCVSAHRSNDTARCDTYMDNIATGKAVPTGKKSESESCSSSSSSRLSTSVYDEACDDMNVLDAMQDGVSGRYKLMDPAHLHAYVSYLWVQAKLNGRGCIGIEDVRPSDFPGSTLEQRAGLPMEFNPVPVSALCMAACEALANCTRVGYTVNPLDLPLRTLTADMPANRNKIIYSMKQLADGARKHDATVDIDNSWKRSTSTLLWTILGLRIGEREWNVMLTAATAEGRDNDVRLLRACLMAQKRLQERCSERLTETFHSLLNRHAPLVPRMGSMPITVPRPGPIPVWESEVGSPAKSSAISTSEDSEEERDRESSSPFEVGASMPVNFRTARPGWVSPRNRARNVSMPSMGSPPRGVRPGSHRPMRNRNQTVSGKPHEHNRQSSTGDYY